MYQHSSSHYRGGAYLQHLPSLAIHLITVRDLSREESMCYILEMTEYRLKIAHTASPLRQVKARPTRRKDVSEGEEGRKKGSQLWTLIDVWQLVNVYLMGPHLKWEGDLCFRTKNGICGLVS